MAEGQLVASAEFSLSTDFAILVANQTGARRWEDPSGVFAVSWAGMVLLTPGTKYADPTVRLERWTGRPPRVDQDWEDVDELPFE